MTFPHEFILTLKLWKNFGPKNIVAVGDYLSSVGMETISPEEFPDVIDEILRKGIIKRIKESPSPRILREAHNKALRIMEESERLGIRMVSRFDEDFPYKLKETLNEKGKEDIPLFLFYKGNLSIASIPAVTIIGTREPTQDGVKAGEYLGEVFAAAGINVVSGLALGCDASAHSGAIKKAFDSTTAFLAHGLETIFPKENANLASRILEHGGLLMSEYPVGRSISKYALVARDRLQAALGGATIVIQTGIHGGTMHAVRATALAGKPIYALRYKSHVISEKIAGNEYLIQSGIALPLGGETVQDVIDRLKGKTVVPETPQISEQDNEPTLFN